MFLAKKGLSRAKVEEAIAEHAAQLGIVMPRDIALFSGAGTLTASAAYLHKFRVAKETTITSIRVSCIANASGFNGDAGIFSHDGSQFVLERASGSKAVAAATTGALTFALSATFTCQPGTDYWMAFVSDSATPTFLRITPGSGAVLRADNLVIARTSLMPLATFTTPLDANNVLQIWGV